MSKRKIVLLVISLFSFTLLNAGSSYEKEFITLVKEMVKDGNISSVSKVDCHKGDCRVDDLVLITTDTETGLLSTLSTVVFEVKDVENFIEFKHRDGMMQDGDKRQFAIELSDIRLDGQNLLFDKPKMTQELGDKSELFLYFKKYLDTPTDGKYTLSVETKRGNVIIRDSGQRTTGEFMFGVKRRYTMKGGRQNHGVHCKINHMADMTYIILSILDHSSNKTRLCYTYLHYL